MDRISKYEIRGELGHGGFGTVYRAYDPMMRRNVAIKILHAAGDPGMMARFRSEAGTTGNLNHSNIITVYDYGEHSGQPYLVMELLDGQTLENTINGGPPLPLLEKVRVLTKVAEGLQYAHENGVVHRDVKPANVMLLEGGGVKILDFGIARFMDQSRTRHTTPGFIIGTIEYMAPDQIETGDADRLTDIFSFGVMSYELLTGTQPFRAAQMTTVVYRLMSASPTPLCQLAPDCPEALERIVHTAMAKDRSQRYQNLQDLLFDLAPIEAHLRRSRAGELALQVGRLIENGDLDGAQAELRRLLDLDPTHEAGQELRREIQRRRDQGILLRRVHELIELAEEQLARKAFEAAIETFETALRSLPSQSDLALRVDIESRLSATRKLQDQAIRFDTLLGQAKDRARQGDLLAASQWAAAAVELDPSSAEAAALREQFAQEEQRQRIEAERVRRERLQHDEVVQKVTQRAREHVGAGRFPEAEQLVAGALKRYPDDADLNSLREELAKALQKHRGELEAERLRAEAERLCAEAESLRAEEERLRAIEQQRRLEEERKQSIEAERLRRERVEREQRIGLVIGVAGEHVQTKRFLEATRLLANALERYPGDSTLTSNLAAVEAARRKHVEELEAERLRAHEERLRLEKHRRLVETQPNREQSPAPEFAPEVAGASAEIEAPPSPPSGTILGGKVHARRRTVIVGVALLAIVGLFVATVAKWPQFNHGNSVITEARKGPATAAPDLKRPGTASGGGPDQPGEKTASRTDAEAVNPIPSPKPATSSAAVPAVIPPPKDLKRSAAPTPEPPKVVEFKAEPASIQRGQSSVLKWEVTGDVESVSVNQGIGAVPDRNAGVRRVIPADSVVYTLTAAGPGGTTTASVAINVATPPPPAPAIPSKSDLQARERQAIVQTLNAFAQAVQSKNEDAVRAIWPRIPASQLERWRSDFQNARSVTFEIRPKSIPEPNGDVVRVECDTTTKKVYADSQVYSAEGVTRITLRKLAGTWKIELMR